MIIMSCMVVGLVGGCRGRWEVGVMLDVWGRDEIAQEWEDERFYCKSHRFRLAPIVKG